jgi:Tfp pilus assembly protein PilN
MISLLSPEGKKRLARERKTRFVSVLLLLLTAVSLVLLAFSVPIRLMQQHQLRNMGDKGDLLTELETSRRKAEKKVAEVNVLLKHIDQQKENRRFSEIINKIDELSGSEISLTQFSFDTKNKLTLQGQASARTALSEFRDRLEEDKQFSSVELPLSNLVSERDVAFTITLIVK